VATHVYKFIAHVHTILPNCPMSLQRRRAQPGILNLIVIRRMPSRMPEEHRSGHDKIRTELSATASSFASATNGCGIPPENLAKLYEPFFTTKEVVRGSPLPGAGLFLPRTTRDVDLEAAGRVYNSRHPISGGQVMARGVNKVILIGRLGRIRRLGPCRAG